MKIKTKPKKSRFKILSVFVLLMLCVSIIFSSKGTMEVCHALSSWNPITGFQPGISVDLGGGGFNDTPFIPNPDFNIIMNPNSSDESLKAYSKLKVLNGEKNINYGGWNYMSFIEYFDIVRNDGRLIYDDDGVIDVSRWNSNGNFGYSDEIVDFACDLYVKTTLMPYNFNGFFNTVINTKFKTAHLYVTVDDGDDPIDRFEVAIHDTNANNMGSGNYRNGGINPGNEYYKLFNNLVTESGIPYGKNYITIDFYGEGYWENGWWGGCYDYTDITSFLTGFIPVNNRSFANSLKANADVKTINNNFYYQKPFVVTATNLNNFVKINNTKAIPITDKNIVPFKDGFRIGIMDDGKTKIQIENGFENRYSDYYCIVDSAIPDINLTYLNANGLDQLKENAVQTDASGIKSQLLVGGMFKDEVQVNFGASENESPETAMITHNGKTTEIQNGTWLKENGDYSLVVKDLVGHSKTIKFTIDNISPNANFDRLESDKTYKISKWYLTTIPYGFNGYGTYSFKNKEDAIKKACECEKLNLVTNYNLEKIEDFKYTNLIANGDSVKVGPYYYYKSLADHNINVYYFSEELLDNAITFYASKYVSDAKYYYLNSDIFPNDYGNNINSDMYHNIWNESKTPAFIANNFTFKKIDELENYKIFYDYLGDEKDEFTEFVYNIPFINQVNNHGLYLIKETDYVGHETLSYIFLDKTAPMLEVTAKIYGNNQSFKHTISKNDIPNGSELVFYYEEFAIDKVVDDDTWYVLEIKNASGKIERYTHLDALPNFNNLSSGEYQITVYDRVDNHFSFKVCMLGKSPKVRFETINDKANLKITIISGEQYNAIMDLKIYRNENLFSGVSVGTKIYEFDKGGIYKVVITDNFGRITTHEFKFEKNMPLGILKGVKDCGKTKGNVDFVFNHEKYTVSVFENEKEITSTFDKTTNMTTLHFLTKENIENNYKIILYDNNDLENFNIYKFTIKTIPPALTLNGVKNGEVTASDVFASFEINTHLSATYTLNNGEKLSYLSGQVLSVEGDYIIALTDELGNANIQTFRIDKSLNFNIYEEDKIKQIEEIRYTNKSIKIVNNEPLKIEIIKNNLPFDYSYNSYFNEEGKYLVKVYDEYGNVKYFEFEIDKTNPKATLHNVENKGITSSVVMVTFEEENLYGEIYCNENLIGNCSSGSEIKLNGNYKVIVYDRAKNKTEFTFKIDNKIEFEINTFQGGISNGGVRVVAKEELKIVMHKNGEIIPYNFEQILNDDGNYTFILTDTFGNNFYFEFTILNSPLKRIEKKLDASVSVIEIKKGEEILKQKIENNTLYLIDEGKYLVTIYDKNAKKNFSFNLELDTTPPTIELVGVTSGAETKNDVSTKNPSEKPIYIKGISNGENFDYKLGDTIKNVGSYELKVYDKAGNETTYTFTKIYALNGASIGVIAGLLAVVVLIIIFLVKGKHTFYKGKHEITTIEEESQEIDSIEEK